MSQLEISISAEPIAHLGNFVVTNSMLTSVIGTALLLIFVFAANRSLKKSGKPSKFQSLVEFMVEALHNLVVGIAGPGKKTALFAPFIVSFFLFIMFNNWIGLIPGVGTIGITEAGKFVPIFRAATSDLNTTIALAIISVAVTQVFGFMFQKVGYLKKYFNFSNPINFFLGILELVLEFAKIISFAFRLFGNIFAGEVLIAVMMFLVPVIVPMPFYGLELFVGFIQALVFALLSLVFFNMAAAGHEETE
ncbi:MAG TPA: F0F1 ATP synthase subunit A [Candidatus Saccharimonadia bacterium]|nr:F0F1 ATP synthase subunit A [Candidatus Saccharimonadia bacterium]